LFKPSDAALPLMSKKKNIDIDGHLPPQDTEAERALLACMLLDEDACAVAFETLREEFFYEQRHQYIFEALKSLFEKGQKCDLITLTDALRKSDRLEAVGNVEYLTRLFDLVPTAAHFDEYVRIVRDAYVRRSLIRNATQIVVEASQDSGNVEELLDSAERLIFEVSEHKSARNIYSMRELVKQNLELYEKIHQNQGLVTGLPSGYSDLDNLTAGFQQSDLIIIAARPGVGKTSFACNIAQNVAVGQKIPVLIFSLEMSKEQLVQRMLCAEARIDLMGMRKGILSDSDLGRLMQAAGTLEQAPIFIDDSPGLSPFDIRTRARRMQAREKIQLIVIDYVQLMRSRGRYENRQQEISDISGALKSMAKELSVPVITLSQMSRWVEHREESEPRLADLRESGALEQDADVVIFLYRDRELEKSEDGKGVIKLKIAKQRNGPTDILALAFISKYLRFENYTKRQPG